MAKRRKKKLKKIKKKGVGFSLKKEAILSIFQIGLFAVGGLILVSFSRQSSALVRLNDTLMAYFGWTTIFLPFIFISFGLLTSKLKNPLGQPNVSVGATLFFVSSAALFKAGNFGQGIWEGVAALVTGPGAYVVLLGTTSVGLVIMFNTSFDQFLMFFLSILVSLRRLL